MRRARRRPSVVAIYCPLWHAEDHARSWKGEGWCEWELVKSAVPRFPGHRQPLRPSWGFFDESDPGWAAREVALAADHDWSDYFPAPFGKPWNMWLPSRHTPRGLERIIAYCIRHCFRRAHYWRVNGRLFFSIFQPVKFVDELGGPKETRTLLRRMDRRLRDADLPPIHWNAMLWTVEPVPMLKDARFRSTTTYAINTAGKAGPDLVERYEDVMDAHRRRWHEMSAATPPYLPVLLNAWNEWTEGSYLLPEERTGTAYLEAVRGVFKG